MDTIDWNTYGYNVRDSNNNLIHIYPIVSKMKLKMFGIDREASREESYFTNLVPHKCNGNSLDEGEYMYSFSLYPFINQPSGAANFTEIPDSVILINLTKHIIQKLIMNKNLNAKIEVWGRELCILRVMSGMAGLAFYLNKSI